ncbi:hypothetical protein [Agromyces lapidis]|uniref:HK97 gp10 family phage protein n=1 Tax=Agromyces lapidis TaxID=279574 RepID=A0ABV5SMG0_9MICO|nr:hypothetical protein [Agromyces lapidis]
MPVQVVIDPTVWNRLAGDLKAYDKKLYAQMRKRIRDAGKIAVDKVRDELGKPAPSRGNHSVGARAGLAAGTRFSLSFSAKRAGVRIVTSPSRLAAGHKGFALAYNKPNWRHPVYGSNEWVSQEGRPYFGKVIGKALNKEILDEIQSAIDDSLTLISKYDDVL